MSSKDRSQPRAAENTMKLSHASSYALHSVAHLAAQKPGTTIASHTIAKARNIKPRFLLKVLKPLVSHRILASVKGPSGGYRLARPASEITVLEIIEAAENNRIRGTVGFNDAKNAALSHRIENVCKQAATRLREYLGGIKVSDLVGRKVS